VAEIAREVSLTTAQVYYWRRKWAARRLDIFPALPEDGSLEADVVLQPGVDVPRLPLDLRDRIGILPADPMAEAGRKAMLFHFERMLLHEPGARRGEDIEGVHDMRVATRRMRSAYRLFNPFFQPRAIRSFRKDLRRTGLALGEVRDLDVFMEKAQRFLDENPDVDLAPLVEAWEKRLVRARHALTAHLDSPRFSRFVEDFHTFLTTPGQGALELPAPGIPAAYQARHIAPRLIYELYEQVRAYETVLDGAPVPTLHALRIAFKRLRYALEFFEEILGPEVRPVIKEARGMQDHLGDLNDAHVAAQVLHEFVDAHYTQYSGVPASMRPDISGVLRYAAAKEDEKRRLLETFPRAWASFTREEMRRALALALAAL
jgi:CHAD domain-containing protein